jgi:metallophosphoesterase (TIGR03767 family)
MERFGFPVVAGMLDAARAPFKATGLNHPWLVALGNHDQLVLGNLPPSPLLEAMATGAVKITAPTSDAQAAQLAEVFRTGRSRTLADMVAQNSGLARLVTPDPKRRLLSRAEMVREHFKTTGLRGHGFTKRNLSDGTAYYGFSRTGAAGSRVKTVRGIALDTNNPSGYADGSIDRAQLRWLEAELKAGSSRYFAPDGTRVRHAVKDRLFVIFSHHTLGTMANGLGGGRVLGDEVKALLLRFPNVVLWVNGHTHVNEVIPHRRASGGGFWEVNTAAHIDWPQQSRIIELVDNTDGTLSIFATVIDSAAPESYGGKIGDPLHLAALSRELSANDWQEDNDLRRGKPEDRNVELLIPAPF